MLRVCFPLMSFSWMEVFYKVVSPFSPPSAYLCESVFSAMKTKAALMTTEKEREVLRKAMDDLRKVIVSMCTALSMCTAFDLAY